ncbi:hypothetical protein TrLO_g5573 [Triparma laevis f. longispina]|uniref:Uncharacterized protein n=1 Tax=Triparma laevis f. longispina TaxID=1714387 RepID=A0A9W7ACK9_9STRA|nr:hypothetical protein TrLO_g5573 [Triparma laevis f. longispina]
MGKKHKKVHVAPAEDLENPQSPTADQQRPSQVLLAGNVEVDDVEMVKAGMKRGSVLLKTGVGMGLNELKQLNLLKKENRDAQKSRFKYGFKLLMNLTADPLEEAEKLGVNFDGSKVEVLTSMFLHLIFLAIFSCAIFLRMDLEQPFRMQYAVKEVLEHTEIERLTNVFFEDINNVEQIYQWSENVLTPSLYRQSFYNGRSYPGALNPDEPEQPAYEPYFFGDSSMTLGRIRVRQVRSVATPCTAVNSSSFISALGDCYNNYKKDITDDRGGFTAKNGDYFHYMNDTHLEDDGPWQSPITLNIYDSGGYVSDLPVGNGEAKSQLQNLKQMNFIDKGTRALFMDFGLYCPNNDQFLSGRVVFEFTPSGAILPFMELIPAALLTDVRALTQDESTGVDLAQLIFELVLYIVIIAYLTKASDKIAEYPTFSSYLANPWNSLDMLNVACFIAVFAIRLFWMMLAYKIEYDVTVECMDETTCLAESEFDDDKYTPFRLPIVYYSFGKTFFAFGTLLSFIKTFRFIGVSRKLNIFTETINKAASDVCLLMLIFVILISGFSVGFHIAFGGMVADYKNFLSSALSLLLLSLGDFDAQELRTVNPLLGMFLFTMYALVMIFVLLTMMLKIVDNAFHDMRLQMMDARNQKENLPLQMRLAVRKIFYDKYWAIKVQSVIRTAAVTEKMIEAANKNKTSLKGLMGKKSKEAKYIDESLLDLIEVDSQAKKDEEEQQKREEKEQKKKEKKEAKSKKKTMTRSERKKRRAERVVVDTNLPENRRIVREAIKDNKLHKVAEDQIDPLEITDRMDMMSHRSDILLRSAQRLLDQVMTLKEEANQINFEEDEEASVVPKKKPQAPPYGKTGEMFGLRGVREPNTVDDGKITDLEEKEGETYVMKVPKLDEDVAKLEEVEGTVGADDIGNMYKSLGYDEKIVAGAKESELKRLEEIQEAKEKEKTNAERVAKDKTAKT